jgi:hypothetical protein
MEFFQLHHPLNVTVLCGRKGCEQVADYLEVDDHGHEYRLCAIHTDSKTHSSRLPTRKPSPDLPFRSRPADPFNLNRTASTLSGLLAFMLACIFALLSSTVLAEPIPVQHKEGIAHAFLVLRTREGRTLAAGELIQDVSGDQISSEIVFHFKDGSVHDEVAVFSQEHTFRLISDHLVQKGPSFPHPVELTIDAKKNEVTVRSTENGKEKDATDHIDLPEDTVNGMIFVLLTNISSSVPETKVSMVAPTSKPRLVNLAISPKGERLFSFAGTTRKAFDYDLKVEIGGVAGVVAPLVGKQPPDTHIWVSGGAAPTVLRFEGALYEGGPIWRIDSATVKLSNENLNAKSIGGKNKRQ